MKKQKFAVGESVFIKNDPLFRLKDGTVCIVTKTNIRGMDENYLLEHASEGYSRIISGEYIEKLEVTQC